MVAHASPLTLPRSLVRGNRREHDALRLECVSGAVPAELKGHYFVVAPAGTVSEPRGLEDRVASQMCGDGLVCRVDFEGGRASATTRLARTPCLLADEGTWVDPDFARQRFVSAGIGRLSPALGSRNFLNCAFQPMGWGDGPTRLLLTYDAGRPFEIDPVSLELVTPVGRSDEWRAAALPGHPFPVVLSPAHPAFDSRTGELFTTSYGRSATSWASTVPSLSGAVARREASLERVADALSRRVPAFAPTFTELVRWRGEGELSRHRLVLPSGEPLRIRHCVHQVAVTEDWVVILDTGFKLGLQQLLHRGSWLRPLVTRPQMSQTVFYLARRRDLERGGDVTVRTLAIPMESDHFLVDYRNPDGRLTLHVAHCPATDLSEWVRPDDVSPFSRRRVPAHLTGMMAVGAMDVNRLGRYVVEAETARVLESRVVSDDLLTWALGVYAGRGLGSGSPQPEELDQVYWCSEGFFPELLTRFVHDLYRDYPYRLTSLDQIREMAERGGRPSAVFRADARTLEVADAYTLPPDSVVSSLQFVPRRDSSGPTAGWLLAVVFTPEATEICVLDAADLARGPLARLRHPELAFGFSLHTAWLPEIEARRAPYRVDAREDLDRRLRGRRMRALFETHVFPRLEA